MPIPDVVRKPRISWRREWRLRAEEAGRKLAEVTQQRDAIEGQFAESERTLNEAWKQADAVCSQLAQIEQEMRDRFEAQAPPSFTTVQKWIDQLRTLQEGQHL